MAQECFDDLGAFLVGFVLSYLVSSLLTPRQLL
jgi:hypothetical protein